MSPDQDTQFTEIFRINVDKLPSLKAYQLHTRGSEDQVRAGRKLAFRLVHALSGHGVWTEMFMVTDTEVTQEQLDQAIRDARISDTSAFKDVVGIAEVTGWEPSPQAQADFVAQGLFTELGPAFRTALLPPTLIGNDTFVERDFEVRGQVVTEKNEPPQPAVSISIESQVIFRQDVKQYAATLSNPAEDLIGLFVSDKEPGANGNFFKGGNL